MNKENAYKQELVRAAFNTIIYRELEAADDQHKGMLEKSENIQERKDDSIQ